MNTVVVNFAGSTIAIEYSGERAAHIIAWLFRAIPHNSQQPPQQTYRLTTEDDTAVISLHHNDTRCYHSQSPGDMAEYLMGEICCKLAESSQGGLLLHAAGVAWQGGGIILPGATGSGKSTLSAYLLTQGWTYLTDELVFILWNADGCQAFPRPLQLKTPAREMFAPFWDASHQAQPCLHACASDLVSPARVQTPDFSYTTPIHCIIFPGYAPEHPLRIQRLSQAQCGLMLMQCLANARNLPEHGFPEIVRLARSIPAYRLIYGMFTQAQEAFERIISEISQVCGSAFKRKTR